MLLKRTLVLAKKNLRILVLRKPFATFIRALAIPFIVVFLLSYSKFFFNKPQNYGVGKASPALSLQDALAHDNRRHIVGFVDNGMKDGSISRVIQSLSDQIEKAGKSSMVFSNLEELYGTCASDRNGASPCFAAVDFHSSPSEPSRGGTWNYTYICDSSLGGVVDVDKNTNDAQVYTIPLQRALDSLISNTTGVQVVQRLFTDKTETERKENIQKEYIRYISITVAMFFYFSMMEVTYHLPGVVAMEREIGMSPLIDAMIPVGSPWTAQLIRISSTIMSFAVVYAPGWLAVGVVVGVVAFTESSPAISIIYHLMCGLALTSFSICGSMFFRRAQLSGILVFVVGLVMAIIPQILPSRDQTAATVHALSLLFPSSNYTYFLLTMARFEGRGTGVNILLDLMEEDARSWSMKPIISFIFLLFQITGYPILAAIIERWCFGTTSAGRKLASGLPKAEDPTVQIRNFSKTYRQPRLQRMFTKRKEDVHAVTNLTLNAYNGEILALLGPNGSGKSTTLNSISGLGTVTEGVIEIYSAGGLGIAPQSNVMWKELTVEEHVHIFSTLKATVATDIKAEVDYLITSCDLGGKRHALSTTLSGGQKRKLQLAMMFAGGSAVCCVDEVSSGLDPLSRRKLWDILLAERSKRTLIMTTHFLDEAEFLADTIAIMSKGELSAQGSAATLKQTLGNGYTVVVPHRPGIALPPSTLEVKSDVFHNTSTYRISDSAQVGTFIASLDEAGISDYTISGPTIEELFLKVAGETIINRAASNAETIHDDNGSGAHILPSPNAAAELQKGRKTSTPRQLWILFSKRSLVFRRRWVSYIVAVLIALVGAGVSPLLMRDMEAKPECPTADSNRVDDNTWIYTGSLATLSFDGMVMGPSSKVTDESLDRLVRLYGKGTTAYPEYYGIGNVTDITTKIHKVETLAEFDDFLSQNYSVIRPGGIFLADPPVIAHLPQLENGIVLQNLVDVLASDADIAASYSNFGQVYIPLSFQYQPTLFMFYMGLIHAIYPAFFVLYPTSERLNNLRAMQYSNGVRPLPLWLSHVAFDAQFVLVISIVSTVLLSLSDASWYALGLLWLCFFLHGLASASLGYVLSQFAPSALAAWSFSAFGQLIMYMANIGGMIGVATSMDRSVLLSTSDKIYFTVALISPAASLFRALSTALGQFGQNCRPSSSAIAIFLFGGPVLYLVLQTVIMLGALVWWDSGGAHLPPYLSRKASNNKVTRDIELTAGGASSHAHGLEVVSLTKMYGKSKVLDDVSFSVRPSSIFALLGPNGAGKSTTISLIRGDILPSSPSSAISVAGISPLTHRSLARAHLGVCPQFDAIDVVSVEEMLAFYARIRGVPDVKRNVAIAMRACGIESFASRLTSALSGGTQRKVSLAIALLGNPAVLLLDEPSSGLDAAAKRVLWRTLQAVSQGRAVVLTTHSMEEAEAVCDTVGILSCRMLLQGPRDEIKNKGGGDTFYVHLEASTGHQTNRMDAEKMQEEVLRCFPNARLEREMVAGQMRFQVPQGSGTSMAELFMRLERMKEGLGLSCYSVGKPTLDQVFVNVVTAHGGQEENNY